MLCLATGPIRACNIPMVPWSILITTHIDLHKCHNYSGSPLLLSFVRHCRVSSLNSFSGTKNSDRFQGTESFLNTVQPDLFLKMHCKSLYASGSSAFLQRKFYAISNFQYMNEKPFLYSWYLCVSREGFCSKKVLIAWWTWTPFMQFYRVCVDLNNFTQLFGCLLQLCGIVMYILLSGVMSQ